MISAVAAGAVNAVIKHPVADQKNRKTRAFVISTQSNHNIRAAMLIVAAMAALTVNDAIVKHMSQVFGIGQIMFLRGLVVVLIFGLVLRHKQQPIFNRAAMHPWNMTRALLELLATLAFLSGLALLPLAVASTLAFSSPIFLAVLSSLVLKERVVWIRWLVIFSGFGGILLITNPFSESANWAVVLPLLCAFFVALRDLSIRFVPDSLPSLQLAFTTAWVVGLGGGAYSMYQGWGDASAAWYLWFAVVGLAMFAAYNLYIVGTRIGELTFIGPFKYSSILVAIALGYLIWGDVPDLSMLAGAAVIVGSGILLLVYEKRQMRRA